MNWKKKETTGEAMAATATAAAATKYALYAHDSY